MMRVRTPFEGTLNVLYFNWPTYAFAIIICLIALACAWAIRTNLLLLVCSSFVAGVSLYFMASSLVITHWIYDLSELYNWTWLQDLLPTSPEHIVNLHAGFDETSDALKEMFPTASLSIFDFYDPSIETESSIARARKKSPASIEIQPRAASLDNLDVKDSSADLVLLFLAAHEIRSSVLRDKLFRRVQAALRPDGIAILVEHLRDLPNLLAFGPGALHFFSRQEWIRSTKCGGLAIQNQLTITPFIQVFCLKRSS
jgi:SAM-dependent methyltransferase